jgi:hypothetical protein
MSRFPLSPRNIPGLGTVLVKSGITSVHQGHFGSLGFPVRAGQRGCTGYVSHVQ